ncbi:hypothetical protein [Amycolatopsis sp. NBC_01480]|uniref:hypothetical protein n=1 Tax=Amycolatopsis sp. NBC_01480 TaxID=2903562 RepID=UPI002E290968|nr:hypothetical protein [Amycolatopsis sp. NBC_01480]
MTKDKGLPDDVDPFARRAAAAGSFLPPPPPPDDKEAPDQQESPSDSASNNASNSASIGAGKGKEGTSVSTTMEETVATPPPPPTKEPIGRTQMNARVLTDRFKLLKKYQHKHGATMQAVVDQMLDEYLINRGLLPRVDDFQQ